MSPSISFFFFFNDTATTEIYTLSLHDALPIYAVAVLNGGFARWLAEGRGTTAGHEHRRASEFHGAPRNSDRKSTRLNSSHQIISYAVFCLKKKKSQTGSARHIGSGQSLVSPLP